ncbi:MAG: aspartate carbamoyltransferase [bacterium]
MSLSFENLIAAKQLLDTDIHTLIDRSNHYYENTPSSSLKGKILASLFFEPSTRTRFSFESAMYRLGGHVISLEQGSSSSIKKGESLSDMGKIISAYADIAVVRHHQPGSVTQFAKESTIPIINAGDGNNEHPTQSLVDIFTIYKEKERINNLTIGIMGDLKHSRTVHSLITLLQRYSNTFHFISHEDLRLPESIKTTLKAHNCSFHEHQSPENILHTLDILYVTRIQKERFSESEQHSNHKHTYILKKEDFKDAENTTIMHPLPRVNEIEPSVDTLSNAKYFKQAEYGLYVRMALLELMLKK